MNAGQVTGSAGIVLGIAAGVVPVSVAGFPCGPAAYAATRGGVCRSAGVPWLLVGVVLAVGGTITAAAARPKGERALPTDHIPLPEALGWLVVALVALALVVGALGYAGVLQ